MSRRRSDPAFTLTEMLVIIGLMGVAALLSARLFTASMRVIGDAPKSHQQISQFEHMTRAIERDVWNAISIETPDDSTVRLKQADGTHVDWCFRDDEVIRQTSGEPSPQRWQLNVGLKARAQGNALVLQARDDLEVTRRFPSQMLSLRVL